MSARCGKFVDTNILVYSLDKSMGGKCTTAIELLDKLVESGDLTLSIQSARELYNVYLKKLAGAGMGQLAEFTTAILSPHIRINESIDMYQSAAALSATKQLSFYDALIVQAAIDSDCDTLYTEDLQHGQVFSSVTIVNPFK